MRTGKNRFIFAIAALWRGGRFALAVMAASVPGSLPPGGAAPPYALPMLGLLRIPADSPHFAADAADFRAVGHPIIGSNARDVEWSEFSDQTSVDRYVFRDVAPLDFKPRQSEF